MRYTITIPRDDVLALIREHAVRNMTPEIRCAVEDHPELVDVFVSGDGWNVAFDTEALAKAANP